MEAVVSTEISVSSPDLPDQVEAELYREEWTTAAQKGTSILHCIALTNPCPVFVLVTPAVRR